MNSIHSMLLSKIYFIDSTIFKNSNFFLIVIFVKIFKISLEFNYLFKKVYHFLNLKIEFFQYKRIL